jgi:hypothetical protein
MRIQLIGSIFISFLWREAAGRITEFKLRCEANGVAMAACLSLTPSVPAIRKHAGPTIEQMLKNLSYVDEKGAKGLRLDMDFGIRIKTILDNADVELGGRGVEALRDKHRKAVLRYVLLDKSTQTTFYYDYERSSFGMNSLDNLRRLHKARTANLEEA